ncbi:MAG TPA: DedA family protein [Dehalococcoidia bacterium]|nr:DedA family protein [Dehalococcoidia bacterium]
MDQAPPAAKRAAANRIGAAALGIGLTSLIGGLGVVAVYYPLRHTPYAVQWLLVFALMTGESAAIHLPSEVILPVAGWLLVRDHHLGVSGLLALSAVAAAGNTAGSSLLYAAGRSGGRPLVRRYGRWVLLHEDDVDRAERHMRRHGVWATFVARLLPVVRTYVGFVAGMLRVPLPAFLAATFAGSFVWSAAFIAVGEQLGTHWSRIRGPMEVAGVAVAALLLLVLAAVTLRQLRRTAAHPTKPEPRL